MLIIPRKEAPLTSSFVTQVTAASVTPSLCRIQPLRDLVITYGASPRGQSSRAFYLKFNNNTPTSSHNSQYDSDTYSDTNSANNLVPRASSTGSQYLRNR